MKLIFIFSCFLFLGHSAYGQNEIKMKLVDSLEKIVNDASLGDTIRLRAARKIMLKTIYFDPEFGREKLYSYRRLALEKNNKIHLSNTYKYEGYYYSRIAKYDSAIIAHRKGLMLSLKNGYVLKTGHVYMDIGNVYENMGDLDSALNYYLKAKAITPGSYKSEYIARLSINLGSVYENRGQYKESLHYLEKSLDICLRTHQGGYLAAVYRSLGNVNTHIGAYDRADSCYHQSLNYSVRFRNNNTKFQAIERLANMKFIMGEYPEAVSYYDQAIKISEKFSTPMDLAIANSGLARTYNKMGKHQLAKQTIDTAIELLKEDGINSKSYKIPIVAGEIYFNLSQYNESRKFCEDGYLLAKASNDVEYLVIVTKLLHSIYKKSENTKQSLFYLEECLKYTELARSTKELKDVISLDLNIIRQNEKVADSLRELNRIQEISMMHKSAIQEEKVNFLMALFGGGALLIVVITLAIGYRQKRKRAIILEYKNDVIKQAIKDKDFLLREVNHRVKNNMQMVSGLLQLKAKKTDSPDGREALLDSQSRIYSMSLVHQQMYQEENYELINVTEYIKEILGVLLAGSIMDDEISFEVTGQDYRFDVERAQTIGFIVHELVTNSIKHAWKAQTDKKVKLDLSDKNGLLTLIYSDNGIGLDDNLVISESDSFGLKMIHSFVQRQLKGTIDYIKGAGAHFKIEFDISIDG